MSQDEGPGLTHTPISGLTDARRGNSAVRAQPARLLTASDRAYPADESGARAARLLLPSTPILCAPFAHGRPPPEEDGPATG